MTSMLGCVDSAAFAQLMIYKILFTLSRVRAVDMVFLRSARTTMGWHLTRLDKMADAVLVGSLGMQSAHSDESDMFAGKTTAYLNALMSRSAAIAAIYGVGDDDRTHPVPRDGNIMGEVTYTPHKGIIQKYPGRAVLMLTYTCAAHCRYCQRQDRVGRGFDAEGRLSRDEIMSAVDWIGSRPGIREVILTGGDPLTYPGGLMFASELLAATSNVQVVRIHTRFPLQYPTKIDFEVMRTLGQLSKPCFVGLHVDHPDELTLEAIEAIQKLRRCGLILRSQTVFLKGVNDSVEALDKLFWSLYGLGVVPEYIYHCVNVESAERFVMKLSDEVRIMSELRQRLSGNAYPHHILNIPGAFGKIPLPVNAWDVDLSSMRDFDGIVHSLSENGRLLSDEGHSMERLDAG
jgi:lysine 2,3-aminomutase